MYFDRKTKLYSYNSPEDDKYEYANSSFPPEEEIAEWEYFKREIKTEPRMTKHAIETYQRLIKLDGREDDQKFVYLCIHRNVAEFIKNTAVACSRKADENNKEFVRKNKHLIAKYIADDIEQRCMRAATDANDNHHKIIAANFTIYMKGATIDSFRKLTTRLKARQEARKLANAYFGTSSTTSGQCQALLLELCEHTPQGPLREAYNHYIHNKPKLEPSKQRSLRRNLLRALDAISVKTERRLDRKTFDALLLLRTDPHPVISALEADALASEEHP